MGCFGPALVGMSTNEPGSRCKFEQIVPAFSVIDEGVLGSNPGVYADVNLVLLCGYRPLSYRLGMS